MYTMQLVVGISASAFYTSQSLASEPLSVQAAHKQTYNWLSGASLANGCTTTRTVWSCSLTNQGNSSMLMWDTSQTCSGGTCTTTQQPVSSQWTTYQDLAGVTHAIVGGGLPVGLKPILLSQPPGPPTPTALSATIR